jgi:hypothetical protein
VATLPLHFGVAAWATEGVAIKEAPSIDRKDKAEIGNFLVDIDETLIGVLYTK